MITIKQPPNTVDYVVQMEYHETGKWVDVVTGLSERNASMSLGTWHSIHPGREFRLVKRTFIEEVMPG